MSDENLSPVAGTIRKRPQDDALHLGPKKKAYVPNFPLSWSSQHLTVFYCEAAILTR